jgi:hypothetical protein
MKPNNEKLKHNQIFISISGILVIQWVFINMIYFLFTIHIFEIFFISMILGGIGLFLFLYSYSKYTKLLNVRTSDNSS